MTTRDQTLARGGGGGRRWADWILVPVWLLVGGWFTGIGLRAGTTTGLVGAALLVVLVLAMVLGVVRPGPTPRWVGWAGVAAAVTAAVVGLTD